MMGRKYETVVESYNVGDLRGLEGNCIPKARRQEDVVFLEDVMCNPYGAMGHVARIDYADEETALRRAGYLSRRAVGSGLPYSVTRRGRSVWLLPREEE